MKYFKYFLAFLAISFISGKLNATEEWKAKWITDPKAQNATNTWLCFRRDFKIENPPPSAIARIATDTKYWLWVNGDLVVFEGGLKRGPNPDDTYFDEVDIAPFLKKGNNSISILTWYFGKDGFSHNSSGKAGLLFQCDAHGVGIISDNNWRSNVHPAYESCSLPFPNFRLPEPNIRFDAREDIGQWQDSLYKTSGWDRARELGYPPMKPWNRLVLRPIPQWKNSGLVDYVSKPSLPFVATKDTVIVCTLPANIHITPYLKVEAPAGSLIDLRTDNVFGGSTPNNRAEYVTKEGIQEYESYGWINGHKMFYRIPKGVKVIDLKYRETGYNTEFAGSFTCSDRFLNKIWEKSRRTLYVTMRDTYMDCPDRERAQWWGDEVNEGGEAFYSLSTESHKLFRKGMYELIGWQREDSTLFSPIPSANWNRELPCQMLNSIGYYGFWNYYLHTGDIETIRDLYEGVRKYIHVWKINDQGTVVFRKGEWTWGDWGEERDLHLIFNSLYYLALKGGANMAEAIGRYDDANEYRSIMRSFKTSFNKQFWTGKEYRNPEYKGKTDDRSQGLAVVAGLADRDKYPAILEVLKREEHASPYMEKYILEALFQMGYGDYALERMKKRFSPMVNNPDYTTLFEGWGIGSEGFGGGTVNHAWSGCALTILSQYLCGIEPIKPGYTLFKITPRPSGIERASAKIQSVKGEIASSFIDSKGNFELDVTIPSGTEAVIGIPDYSFREIRANGKVVWRNRNFSNNKIVIGIKDNTTGHIKFKVRSGKWKFIATK